MLEQGRITVLRGKYPPSGSHLLQGDGVSEALELGDEALGLAVGIPAGVVVAAEVGVELAGGQHVPGGADNRVLDGAEPTC